MDVLNAFQIMDQAHPFVDESYDPQSHEPQFHDTKQMGDQYYLYRVQPRPYNIEGYISPYASNNWDTSSGILSYVDDTSRLPALETKMDPNRIFSSDIAALRALAADQNKITKIFEKRLMESLTDKSKFGLTEEDVEAMQALTSARAAITNITKEQVAIRKNIADIRLKQAQNGPAGRMETQGVPSNGIVGKAFMDQIFNMPATDPPPQYLQGDQTMGLDQASQILDSIIPTVSDSIQFESREPTTYVLVGDTDDDAEFATFDSNGELISDYPNPTTTIDTIDRDANRAIDSRLVSYPIKYK